MQHKLRVFIENKKIESKKEDNYIWTATPTPVCPLLSHHVHSLEPVDME